MENLNIIIDIINPGRGTGGYKNILLCITGSIAAYKACEVIRLLRKQKECIIQCKTLGF